MQQKNTSFRRCVRFAISNVTYYILTFSFLGGLYGYFFIAPIGLIGDDNIGQGMAVGFIISIILFCLIQLFMFCYCSCPCLKNWGSDNCISNIAVKLSCGAVLVQAAWGMSAKNISIVLLILCLILMVLYFLAIYCRWHKPAVIKNMFVCFSCISLIVIFIPFDIAVRYREQDTFCRITVLPIIVSYGSFKPFAEMDREGKTVNVDYAAYWLHGQVVLVPPRYALIILINGVPAQQLSDDSSDSQIDICPCPETLKSDSDPETGVEN